MSIKYYIEKFLSVNLKDYSNIGIDLEINKILFFLAIALTLGAVGLYLHGKKVCLLFKRMIRLEVFGKDAAKSLSDLSLGDNKPIRRLVTNREGYLKKCIKISGEERLTFEEYSETLNGEDSEEKNLFKDPKESNLKPLSERAAENQSEVTAETECEVKPESECELKDGAEREGITENKNSTEVKENDCTAIYLSDGMISPDAKIYIPEQSRDFALKILNNDNGSIMKLIVSCVAIIGICVALIYFMPDLLSILNSLLGD